MHALPLDHGGRLDAEALTAAYAPDPAIPTLRVNFVSSIDGAATVEGRTRALGTSADKRVFDLLRQMCDGLIVGAGTVRDERYGAVRASDDQRAWRVARGLAPDPRLVIVSSRLDLDPKAAVFTEAPVRPIVLTHQTSDDKDRDALSQVADVIMHGAQRVDLPAAVADLRRQYALNQLLCEGGPQLFASLHAAGLVDELCLTISPMLAGPGAERIIVGRAPHELPTTPMRLHHAIVDDGTLMLRYVRA